MKSKVLKEYQVIVVNPNRCTDCEACMTICSFVHDTGYVPLKKRIIGKRTRIELEWAISCDLCKGMKDEFVDPEVGKKPQCLCTCPNSALFISTIESYGNESRMEAIKRVFNEKK